ncbi:MAG: AraC family transcriptional regulator [Anaerolineaceae bacterium]|nr:AraC family transcriptional regulator [Anaerolineaceae bacterium]
MGEHAEAGSWSILGYMMMNCRTVAEAAEKSGRYQRIIGNLITVDVKIHLNRIKAVYYTPPHAPLMTRHCFESTFSSSMRLFRTLTGKEINPVEVTFFYPEPQEVSEYERIFRCPVRFGQKENSLSIHPSVINMPILFANPDLLAYFENYAQEFIREMEWKAKVIQEVTLIILSNLDDEGLDIRKVAREMAVRVRTLQNKLKEEGVVFSGLLSKIREELAKKYLAQDYTVEEITYLLGYSDPSVFRKAFKKWSSITPREYRKNVFLT